jgi:alpha-L-fucosidase
MKRFFLAALLMAAAMTGFCQTNAPAAAPEAAPDKMDWFRDAKFGMFIHWGIYTELAGIYGDKTDGGEWMMSSKKIPIAEYSALAAQFNPVRFDANDWVRLAAEAGQRYMVVTAKHHDGFAMYHSRVSPYNIVDATPFGRDVIAELAQACREQGLRFGFYYSHVQDWYHPGAGGCDWDPAHQGNFEDYLDTVALPQVDELLAALPDVSIVWMDQGGAITHEQAMRFYERVRAHPQIILNNRIGGGVQGDVITPEQFIPATGYPGKVWETCMTMNRHWAYCAYDDNWKSADELILRLVEIVSKGGNLLLNIGPDKYGTIPQVCRDNLQRIGAWMKVNGEAIYGTQASPFPYLPWGYATRKGKTLYLHVTDWSTRISVPCALKIRSARLLADPSVKVRHGRRGGQTWFELPPFAPHPAVSVLAVECESEVPVQAVPTAGLEMKVNGVAVPELTDEDYKSAWTAAGSHEATVEFALPAAQSVQCLAAVEPWQVWDGIAQQYRLEAWIGGAWKTVAEGHGDGTGLTLPFDPVTAQRFRVRISNADREVSLRQLMLFN